ncbi:signal peptide containing protein [Theileria equi strain WA]|uniref:Signal peptide containing protein n=1 Tax=Theileria equi strain WA TaxID=1537102 RepID=L1LEU6_THEEQ|nr:signal peptide containing protein [Theileria equi strain WA]EKX73967.1 signal peptide containing protein [Theileria equi strain WA]|eukprot:XP_004833419.1 signal peptide containing protein [Theileria equi strain WA]
MKICLVLYLVHICRVCDSCLVVCIVGYYKRIAHCCGFYKDTFEQLKTLDVSDIDIDTVRLRSHTIGRYRENILYPNLQPYTRIIEDPCTIWSAKPKEVCRGIELHYLDNRLKVLKLLIDNGSNYFKNEYYEKVHNEWKLSTVNAVYNVQKVIRE